MVFGVEVGYYANHSVFHPSPSFVDSDSIVDHQVVGDHQQVALIVVAVGAQYQLPEIVAGEVVEALEKQLQMLLGRLLGTVVAEVLEQFLAV